MKKLYLPLTFEEGNYIEKNGVFSIFCGDALKGFVDLDKAKDEARKLSLKNPSAKIVICESVVVIEPHRLEFTEKKFNERGELII